MYYYCDTCGDESCEHAESLPLTKRSPKRIKNLPLGPNAPHYPNKNERKMMRKLRAQGRMTKEQVQAVQSNRQKLATASRGS